MVWLLASFCQKLNNESKMSRQNLIILPIYFQILDKRRSYRSCRSSVVRTIITPQLLCSVWVMTRKLDHRSKWFSFNLAILRQKVIKQWENDDSLSSSGKWVIQ